MVAVRERSRNRKTKMSTKKSGRLLRVEYPNKDEGKLILDRQARKYLGMSGEEFIRKYRAQEIEDPDRTEVWRVAMLIPLAEN